MEQVTLTSQPAGLYILNGQAVLIQNGVENGSISGSVNGDIVQQALNGLTAAVTNPSIKSEIGVSSHGNTVNQNYILLDKEKVDDGRVVQLSISDDFPMQLLGTSQQNIGDEESDSALLKNILFSENEKCDSLSSHDILNSFLKQSPKDNLGNQYELVSPLKGKFTYAYQLSDGTKLCPISQAEDGTSMVSIPSVSTKPNGIVSDSSSKGAISKVPPLQNGRKLVYVNKILNGVSLKPRIILNMKSKSVQDQKRRISPKIQVVPSKGKSLLINNPRGSEVQKVATPAVNSHRHQEIVNSSFVVAKDLKTKNSGAPVLLNTLLKTKTPEHNQANIKSLSESSVVQVDSIPQQSSLQLNEQNIAEVVTTPSKEQPLNETKPVGRLTESQLKKIAAVFRNSCLNRTRLTNSTIFDTETNTRIVCRVVYPEDLIKDGEKRVIKRGKKRTRSVDTKKSAPEDEKTKKPPPPSARTRSGRLSRPPRYMVKDFKKLTEDSEASYSDYRSDSDENSENSPFLHLPYPQQRKISTKFHCPTCGKVYLGKRRMLKHFSEYPDHRDGKTVFEWEDENQENAKQQENEKNLWKRIFRKGARKPKLGSAALLKELFHACSNELFIPLAKERIAEHVDPWDYLRTRQLKEGGGVRTLLSDLSSLIKAIPKNLLITAQPEDLGSIHIEDEKMCQLLNISPGHYLPNESALKGDDEVKNPCDDNNTATSNVDVNCEQPVNNCWPIRNDVCPDDPMKMELEPAKIDSVDVSKDDSSELNEILLEKSSLESVDQIVSERLNDLIPASPLDVSSLVEAQVLARSLLTSPPDLLHGVSGSTEDLMKTLENLTPDLPTDSASADFDFTVLSSDFTSDR